MTLGLLVETRKLAVRNPELMLELLKRMSEDHRERLVVPSDSQWDVYHHVELLIDAGHAEWLGGKRSVARITNAGYDFLNAATNPANGKEAKTKFVDLFNGGASYARATQSVVDWVSKLAGA